jgi:hypothetical protein
MPQLMHNEIEGLIAFVNPEDGNATAAPRFDCMDASKHVRLFGPNFAVRADCYNLLCASFQMYQSLTLIKALCEKMRTLISCIDNAPISQELETIDIWALSVIEIAAISQLYALKGTEAFLPNGKPI